MWIILLGCHIVAIVTSKEEGMLWMNKNRIQARIRDGENGADLFTDEE
jgi:hypothetical protein